MKRVFVSSLAVLAMLLVSAGPSAQTMTLAAQKKQSKPVLKHVPQKGAPSVERDVADPQTVQSDGSINIEVTGPVFLTYTLPENERFILRVNQDISSATSRANDRFQTTVVAPVYVSGVEVVPAGSIVEGMVTSVVPARSRGREGEIAIAFDTLILPDGTRRSLEGALTAVQDEKAGEVGDENDVSGRSADDRKIIYIGGGGVGGAVLGGAIGGAKGAAIGAIIGAGAGVAGVMLKKGNEAELKSGTEISVMTTKAIVFTVQSDRLDR